MIEPKHDIPIKDHTHYEIGGIARDVYFPGTAKDMGDILRKLTETETPYYVLGGGSNVLVGDGYWDGAVIITTGMDRLEPGTDHIACGSGVPSSTIAETALDCGKTGLEFLYLLPGSIGGALAMNARYDMTSISDVLIDVTAVHPRLGLRSFTRNEIDFAYKHTGIISEGWYICSCTLSWREDDPGEIRARMDLIEQKRTDSRHFEYPSCGCIFKNDHTRNIQAGKLIDSLGLKGMRVGDAAVADYHANFIANLGNATAQDVITLIEKIEAIVRDRTGIEMEREVRLAGTFD